MAATETEHYVGIDVGTGSARACIMTSKGDIVGLASQEIGLWQPQTGYYVRLRANYEETTGNIALGAIDDQHLVGDLQIYQGSTGPA